MVCWNRQWKRVLGKKGINQGDFQELTERFGQLQSSVMFFLWELQFYGSHSPLPLQVECFSRDIHP